MEYKKLTKRDIFNILYSRFNGEFLSLKDLPAPFSFKDMQKAIKRVSSAIKNQEKIVVVGDYDVDGVVSTTIMRKFFEIINYKIEWIIPNRFRDGYGLSKSIIDRIDANLIITVDNGIAAIDAAKECKKRGIDLIITDHHNIGDSLPLAYAIIDQKQENCDFPFKEVCGAQIAWYFVVALSKELKIKIDSKYLLGYLALAIVADVMPLNGINRVMLIASLQQLQIGEYAFIKALRDRGFLKNFNSETIAYYIAPLLNSAGRLKDASIASDFLYTNDEDEAFMLLDELISLNDKRKQLESKITKSAISQVKEDDNIAIVYGDNWHEGVVGIVASRVANHFQMPSIVLTLNENIYKGSGRSWGDCDLFGLVSSAKEYYLKFGGHKNALGVSFQKENISIIKEILNKNAYKFINSNFIDRSILGELPFNQIDLELIDLLEKFEPYGEANPKPKFFSKSIEIISIEEIGVKKEHKKFRLKDKNKTLIALEFRANSNVKIGDKIDIIYTLNKNEFNGHIYINLFLEKITLI